jgi:tRNA(fMet)-specific endonuclease VapC
MNFLIDTNICSAYLKGNPVVWNKFMQYSGGLAISVVTAGELWTWVSRGKASERSRRSVTNFIASVDVVEIDLTIALRFGELRGTMLDQGTPLPDMDALIAATALAEDLTLVTHNVADFQPVPDLRIEDWLV